jgi:signal peptide peptidase SppA
VKYPNVVHYVATTLWAITPSKMAEFLSVLAYRAADHEFTDAEIKARIGDGEGSPGRLQGGALAIIPIRGVIAHRMGGMQESSGGTSAEGIGRMVRAAMADPGVSTILLDVDSPGGTVPGSQELAGELFELRGTKRIVAHVNSLAASAAYWLASQADEIVSTPSGTIGSIGVFTVHQDLSAALEKEGIKVSLISAGKFKVAGNPFEPLSDEERAVIQAKVDAAYSQFVKDVARGRGVSASDVRTGYGEGRALTAKDAKAAGLIDRIASFDETISRLVGKQPAGALRAEGEPGVLASVLLDDRLQRRRLL